VVPKLAYEDGNISIEIHLANNSSSSANLDVDVNFYAPDGNIVKGDVLTGVTVPANDVLKKAHLIVISDSNASNSPHLLRVAITDSDDNPSNNMMQKWIIVSKGQRKTPVPDMPIALGLVAGIFVLFYISRKK
jgi:hypothetical protein